MNRRRFRSLAIALSLLLVAALGAGAQEFVRVKRVIDGDAIMLQTGERVRLIGVDTPQTKRLHRPVEYFGREAADFTRRMVEGKRVRLELDQANARRKHEYQGGKLAYVYLEDGTLLNAEIIRQGYGRVDTRFPFSRKEEFRRLQKEAREQQRGLWAEVDKRDK